MKKAKINLVIVSLALVLLGIYLVNADWNSNLNIGLVRYYTFNESVNSSGGAVYNDSLGIKNISLSGHSIDAGKIGNSINITDRQAGDLDLGVNTNTTNISLNFWFKDYPSAVGSYIYCSYSLGTEPGTICAVIAALPTRISFYAVNESTISLNTVYNLTGTDWHMWTQTVNSSTLAVYKDGTILEQVALGNFNGSNNNIHLLSDLNNNNGGYNFYFDEFSIWNKTLTQSEITDLYNNGLGTQYNPNVTSDTTKPLINITYPNNSTYLINITSMNYTVSDTNLQSCWYSLNSGVTNISVTCGVNLTSLTSNEGTNTWRVYANDSAGNENYSSITFYKDSIIPNATLISPSNNSYVNNISQNFTANLSDNLEIKNSTLFIYNSSGLVNRTDTTYSGVTNTIVGTVISLFDGIFNWFYSLFDTTGNQYTTNNNTLTIDTANPSINFTSPTDLTYVTRNNILVNVTSSDTNFANITIRLYNSTSLINTSFSTSSTYFINFTGLLNGIHYFNATSRDLANNLNDSSTINFSVNPTLSVLINSINLSTENIFNHSLINSNVSTGANTQISYCNFTLVNPSGNTVLTMKNSTILTDLNILINSNSTILNQSGNWNATVLCENNLGTTNQSSVLIYVNNYTLTANPSTNYSYSFLAISSKTELNGYNISLYDNTVADIIYNVTVAIQDRNNFTLNYPNTIKLNSTDNSSILTTLIFTLNASSEIANGTFLGNITLTNTTYELTHLFSFSYGINPPAGIPSIYSTDMTLCTDALTSTCSNPKNIYTDSSFQRNYTINNTGGFTLNNCTANFSNTLDVGWVSYSPNNFSSINVGELKNVSITFAPTSPGTFWGNFYISCAQGNLLGSTQSTPSVNRPFSWINALVPAVVVSSAGGGGGGGGAVNATELTEGFCGNKVCEIDYDENFLSCPSDCVGETRAITDCFEYNPFGSEWSDEANQCIFKKSTTLLWIFLFLVGIFVYSIFYNPKQTGTRFRIIPEFITNKIKRRRK